MKHHLGSSVLAFTDTVPASSDTDIQRPASRAAHSHLPDGEAGTGTLHVDRNGVIRACSSGAASLLGRESQELLGEVIWRFVPALEGRRLILESRVDPHLAFLCHCGISFGVAHPSGDSVPCRMFIHSVVHEGRPVLRLILRRDSQRANICL